MRITEFSYLLSEGTFRTHYLSEAPEKLFEIDFEGKPEIVAQLMNSPISCGFELECYWTEPLSSNDSKIIDIVRFEHSIGLTTLQPLFDKYPHIFTPEVNKAFTKERDKLFQEWVAKRGGKDEYRAKVKQEEYYEKLLIRVENPHLNPNTIKALENTYKEVNRTTNVPYPEKIVKRLFKGPANRDFFLDWIDKHESLFRAAKETLDRRIDSDVAYHFSMNEFANNNSYVKKLKNFLKTNYGVEFKNVSEDSDISKLKALAKIIKKDWIDKNSSVKEVSAGKYKHTKNPNLWRVETDSSLSNASSKEVPVELVSPAFPTPKIMLSELGSLLEYLISNNIRTAKETGFHVTMSYNGPTQKYNKVKMILLLNDDYWLDKFKRNPNFYTQSQLDRIKTGADKYKLSKLNADQISEIEKLLAPAVSTDKYYAIHFKQAKNISDNNLVEFRIAGNKDYHTQYEEIKQLVIQYAAVMEAGYNPNAFKQEYAQEITNIYNTLTAPLRAAVSNNPFIASNDPFILFLTKYETAYPPYSRRVQLLINRYVNSSTETAPMILIDILDLLIGMIDDGVIDVDDITDTDRLSIKQQMQKLNLSYATVEQNIAVTILDPKIKKALFGRS